MNGEHRFDIGGVTYIMTPENADTAWAALKKAGRLFRGVEVGELREGADGGPEATGKATSAAISAILSNLGDPIVGDIEKLIYRNTNVKPTDGQPYRLEDRLREHFNAYRGHMVRVLFEGVKYQFSDFFAGGMDAMMALLQKGSSS